MGVGTPWDTGAAAVDRRDPPLALMYAAGRHRGEIPGVVDQIGGACNVVTFNSPFKGYSERYPGSGPTGSHDDQTTTAPILNTTSQLESTRHRGGYNCSTLNNGAFLDWIRTS